MKVLNINAVSLNEDGVIEIKDASLLDAIAAGASASTSLLSSNQGDCANTGDCSDARNWGNCTGGGHNGGCA